MVHYCGVCMNDSRRNINVSFFSYPKDRDRRIRWLKAVGREDLITKLDDEKRRPNYRICQAHFEKSCFNFSKNGNMKFLSAHAFPTLNLTMNVSASTSQCQNETDHQNLTIHYISAANVSVCSNTPENKITILSDISSRGVQSDIPNKEIMNLECGSRPQTKTSPTPLGLSADTSRKRKLHQQLQTDHVVDEPPSKSNLPEAGDDKKHVTCDTESQSGEFRVRAGPATPTGTYPEARSFTLDQEVLMDLHELSDKIQNFYPTVQGKSFTVTFKGIDGDKCEYVFSSASETRHAGVNHGGLSCNECRTDITGFRYKCVTCPDYDLCGACEALGVHSQHMVMRISRPLKSKIARTLVKRWCEAMKSAGISSFDALMCQPPAVSRPRAGHSTQTEKDRLIPDASEPDDPGTNCQVISHQPVTVKLEPMDEDETEIPSTSQTTETKAKGSPSKVKAAKRSTNVGKVVKRKDVEGPAKKKVASSVSKVKVETQVGENLADYYGSFAETETELPVYEVKIEKDPLNYEISQEHCGMKETEDNLSQSFSGPSSCIPARMAGHSGSIPQNQQQMHAGQSILVIQGGIVPSPSGTVVDDQSKTVAVQSRPSIVEPGGLVLPSSQDSDYSFTTYSHKSQ